MKLTDKAFHVYSLGRQRNQDGIEIVRIGRGIDDATLEREPSILSIINSSSPLRLDSPMAAGIIEMAKAGQIVCLTPFTLAGAILWEMTSLYILPIWMVTGLIAEFIYREMMDPDLLAALESPLPATPEETEASLQLMR